jgi:uncharacterized protein YrrD
MQFESGAVVLTANNDKVGKVDRVVLDPRTKEVTHIIVRKGMLFKKDKVLPVTMVAAAEPERVSLRPDAGDLSHVPDFEEAHYVMADDATPAAAARATDEAPAISPGATRTVTTIVGAPAMLWNPPAIGVNNYGPAVSVEAPRVVKVIDRNIPDNTVPLKEGAKVVAADGETVGHVERVFVNSDTKQATHLLVEHGKLAKTHKTIPVHWVDTVFEREVHLAVSSRLLEGLPEFKN